MVARRLTVLLGILALAVPATATGRTGSAPGLEAPVTTLEAPASGAAWARDVVSALPRATTVNDADANRLFDDLDAAFLRAAPGHRLPVIVSFVEGTPTAEGVARVLRVTPGAVVARSFTIIPAFAGALSREEALRVASLPQVRQIELDRPGAPELDTATVVMGPDAVVDEMGIDGSLDGASDTATVSDVGIAVLDTGFHTAHVDLDGKLVAWRDFATNQPSPYDPDGHGTHVASIAAGWGRANPDLRGVAPGASVIGIKISGGGSTTSNTIAGYEWLVENKEDLGVRVATISFGFGTATDGTTALERTVDETWDAGIVCFKSTGNSGPDNSSMTVPAAARGILAIGSLLDPFGSGGTKYGFALSEYSSRGPTSDGRIKPDLTAPGESIRAAQAGTTAGSVVLSGTSMASPFAAGTAALVLDANPALQPDDVRALLYATAEDRGADGPDNDFGYGRIQAREAVQEAARLAGSEPPPSSPPAVPVQETLAGAAVAGLFEAEFTIADTEFPVAAVALGGGLIHVVDILDASGDSVVSGTIARFNVGADRQHTVTLQSLPPGEYRVRVVATPGSEVVVDLSHSSADG